MSFISLRLHRSLIASFAIAIVSLATSQAALIVNSAQTITHRVTINPIIVSDDAGSNTATYFGTAETEIKGLVNDIWAQAGIEVVFKSTTSWNSTFALSGDPADNSPRPTSDLDEIVSVANLAGGILDSDSNVINMFFVAIPAGFSALATNQAAGLAYVGGNGITQFVGASLPGSVNGREAAASVVAHEIGHNLGLSHLAEAENLLQEGGAANQGERLNASQISTAQGSSFAVAIPEPSTAILVAFGSMMLLVRRRVA